MNGENVRIVVSSRVRLARNYHDLPFSNEGNPENAELCISRARQGLEGVAGHVDLFREGGPPLVLGMGAEAREPEGEHGESQQRQEEGEPRQREVGREFQEGAEEAAHGSAMRGG